MTPRRLIPSAMLLALLPRAVRPPPREPPARELRARAADLTYNLDPDEAVALLRRAVAAEPNDPANHRALASTIWLNILFKRGAVTVDHYLGSVTRASVEILDPPRDRDAELKREIAQAIEPTDQQPAPA